MLKQIILISFLFFSHFASSQNFKVLTYNIYMLPGIVHSDGRSERSAAIGELLNASGYDVVVMQEAFDFNSRKVILEKMTSYPYVVGPPGLKQLSVRTNSGLWAFSRHKITSVKFKEFKNRAGVDALARKGVMMVEILFNGKVVQVFNTHLQNSGGDAVREKQLVEMKHMVDENYKKGVPQVLCGDYNVDSKSAMYDKMLKILDAADSYNGAPSYDRKNNDLHVEGGEERNLIDYVLSRNCSTGVRNTIRFTWRWSDSHVDLSDHYTVSAEFSLQ